MGDREDLHRVMDRLIEEVWNDQRLDVVPEIFQADATLNLAAGALNRIDAIREEYMRPVQTAFPDLHHEVADLFFGGDKIAMRFIGTGTHRGDFDGKAATGKKLNYEGIALFLMEENRISKVWAQSNGAHKFAEL